MDYRVKVQSKASYRRGSAAAITVVALFVLFAVFMAVYTLSGESDKRIVFGIGYIIAAILGLMYVIIRVNTVYATYLAADNENLYMKNWSNHFMPYKSGGAIKLISSFVPAKTGITVIPINKITSIIIGTKNFIKRNAGSNEDFIKEVRAFEHSRDSYEKKQVRGMDMFYAETSDGESCYMPIEKFDNGNMKRLLKLICLANPGIEVKTVSRQYKAFKTKSAEEKEGEM